MRLLCSTIVILFVLCSTISKGGASEEVEGRLISAIEIEGIKSSDIQFVLNNIRTAVGDEFDASVADEDVHRITRLGRFKPIDSRVVLQEDGTVHVVFVLAEQPYIVSVNVKGNKLIADGELLSVVRVIPGTATDPFLIDKGRRAIEGQYRKLGNYLVDVEVDEAVLNNTGVLIYIVTEGPRVRVKSVRFEGNKSITGKQLSAEVKTSVWVPFLRRGELNEYILEDDVLKIGEFYRERGYLEVRVDKDIVPSSDNKSAIVIFQIKEGWQYIVGDISTTKNYFNKEFGLWAPYTGDQLTIFSSQQIAALVPIRKGDIYKRIDIKACENAIIKAYGALGHVGMKVRSIPIQSPQEDVKDLIFDIDEGELARVGLVLIKDNHLTKDEVIRGRINLRPGYLFDGAEPARAELRLKQTRLFNDVTMTIQDEDPNNPGVRDLVVEVKEMQTGSMNFGLLAGSDEGVMGTISLVQRNFDLADFPASWSEFWQGKAFRGAGQGFKMAFQPGDEVFNYQISLSEPRFLQTDYFVSSRLGWTRRDYSTYDEEKLYSLLSVGRRFGDIWSGRMSLTSNRVRLTNIDEDVPVEIYNDRGPSSIDSIGISAYRTTLHPFARPQKGSRFELSLIQFGIPSGDYTFTKALLQYTTYFTVDRDFLGHATTLRLDSRLGYIFGGDSPTFDRLYLGGRSFRGFDYRTISPKGTPRVPGGDTDVPIGGDWKIFLGAQYEMPLVGDLLSAVFFVDSGTIVDSPSFDEYRVSIGTGIRMHIPGLGDAPLAFDFGFPVVKQTGDEKRTFSFSIQLPF